MEQNISSNHTVVSEICNQDLTS